MTAYSNTEINRRTTSTKKDRFVRSWIDSVYEVESECVDPTNSSHLTSNDKPRDTTIRTGYEWVIIACSPRLARRIESVGNGGAAQARRAKGSLHHH